MGSMGDQWETAKKKKMSSQNNLNLLWCLQNLIWLQINLKAVHMSNNFNAKKKHYLLNRVKHIRVTFIFLFCWNLDIFFPKNKKDSHFNTKGKKKLKVCGEWFFFSSSVGCFECGCSVSLSKRYIGAFLIKEICFHKIMSGISNFVCFFFGCCDCIYTICSQLMMIIYFTVLRVWLQFSVGKQHNYY